MAGHIPGDSSNHGRIEGGSSGSSPDAGGGGGRWYFSRKEIEESTPSRRDNIDLKKETYLRKSYCTFVQDLGMRLKVPQVTIATAIIFCHRFFLRHSHAKNDRRPISTVCMFLAGKVEETPRPLKDVILVSYDIIHKKDPVAAQRIKQKEVYEQQKELILLGERLVLATLAFDLNVHHPYKPLVEAIKKFKVEKHALAQVAWNFVNDGLRTSLCLQFQPHHIAAGAIFLAAKFLKVKLPSDGEKVWWQEFDVTPRQLEEVSNQMLELYEQNRVPQSQGSEVEVSTAGGKNLRAFTRNPSVHEEQVPTNGPTQAVVAVKTGISLQSSSRPPPDHPNDENNHNKPPLSKQNHSNESMEMGSVITDHNVDAEVRASDHSEHLLSEENTSGPNKSKPGLDLAGTYDQERNSGRGVHMELHEGQVGQSPRDTIKMIDKDKVKAALEKRKKSRGGDMARKKDLMDEDDLIERALEDGVELAVEDEKIRQERRQRGTKTDSPSPRKVEVGNVEEGEMLDGASPTLINRKRKRSPLDRQIEWKKTLPPH